MECLLRICFRHLHGSGMEIKVAMPASFKGLWLIAFIHFQFDKHLEARRAASSAEQADAGHPLRSTKPFMQSCKEANSDDAQYSSCLARLLDTRPDLFQNYMAGDDVNSRSGEATESEQDAARPPAGRHCEACRRPRDRRGVGSPLCHGCSGVDDWPLTASPLRAVIERRRLLLREGEGMALRSAGRVAAAPN